MFNLARFLEVAVSSASPTPDWLQGAPGAVDYLVKNARSDEIILFANPGQIFVHAILVPVAQLMPPDGEGLQHANLDPYAHWALEHVSGGGEPDRMYLSPPIDAFGCASLTNAEQLVFRRHFDGVDKGSARTELSQPLVQALGLYWLDEESAFCRLNDDGDIEPVIRLRDLSAKTGQSSDMLVTINAEPLHRYMAVTETALVIKFDFTRYRPNSMTAFIDPVRGQISDNDLFYHTGVQAGSSFANGVLIVRPLLTKDILIAKSRRKWNDADKPYAVFKAQDWKNNCLAEISCAPSALASYFDKDSPLPFQVTPAFFRPEVLQRYKADPEKYRLEHRSIYSRGGWYLKSYDVNEAGQVHAYLYDLAKLPYNEQLYWQSFNEWPKAPIADRAFQTDIEGSFSDIPDPLIDIKGEISKLDKLKPDWWNARGEAAAAALHYPITASPEEWSNALLALDQFVIEGFVVKELRSRLEKAGREFDKQWGSLRLLQDCLIAVGLDDEEAVLIVAPLKAVHALRSKVKGHLAEVEKQAIIKEARSEHGSLAAHFRKLAEDVQISFDRIIELL